MVLGRTPSSSDASGGCGGRFFLLLVQVLQPGHDAVRSEMVNIKVEIVELLNAHVVECNGIVTDAFNTLHTATTQCLLNSHQPVTQRPRFNATLSFIHLYLYILVKRG